MTDKLCKKDLEQLWKETKPWLFHKVFGEYLASLPDVVELSERRTGSQNAALHLWFRQIADVCNASGLDAHILFSKTLAVDVTESMIKDLWHKTQVSYFGTDSTAQLTKSGQMEKIQDTLIRFFAERHGIELPPFPNFNMRIEAVEAKDREDYPEYNGAPSF